MRSVDGQRAFSLTSNLTLEFGRDWPYPHFTLRLNFLVSKKREKWQVQLLYGIVLEVIVES